MRTKSQLDTKSSSGAPSEAGDSTPAVAAAPGVPPSPVKKSDRLAQKRLLGGPLTGLAAAVAAVGRPAKRPRTSVTAPDNTDEVSAAANASSSSSRKRGRPANPEKLSSAAQRRRSVGRPPTKALQLQQQQQQQRHQRNKSQEKQPKPPLLPLAAQRRSLGASAVVRLRRLSSNDADLLAVADVARDSVALPGRRSTDTLECNKQLKRLVASLRDVCPAGYRACSLIDPREVNAEAEAKVAGLACLGLVPTESGQAIREAIQGQALRLQLHRATSSRQPMRLCRHVHKRQPDPNILVLHNGKYISKDEVRRQKQAAQAASATAAASSLEQQRRRRLATLAINLKQRAAAAAAGRRRHRHHQHHAQQQYEPRRHRLWPLCLQPNLRWSSQPTFSLHPASAKFVKDADVASDSLGGVLSAEEDDEEIDELLLGAGDVDDGDESEGGVSSSVEPTESRADVGDGGADGTAKSTASSGSQGFEVAGIIASADTASRPQQRQKQQTRPQKPDQEPAIPAMRFGKRRQRRLGVATAAGAAVGGIENEGDSASSSASLAAVAGVRRSKRKVDLRSKLLQWKMFNEERKQLQQQPVPLDVKRRSSAALSSGKLKVSIMDSDKKRQPPLQQQLVGKPVGKKKRNRQLQQHSLSMPTASLVTADVILGTQPGSSDAALESDATKMERTDADTSTVPKQTGSSAAGPSGIRPERKQIFVSSAGGGVGASGGSVPAFPLSHSLTRELQALTNDLSCDVEIQRSMPFDKFIVNVVDLSLGDLETLQERLDDSSFKLRAVKHKLVNSTGLVFCAVLVQRKSNVIRSIRRMLDSADNWESSSSNASDADEDAEDETAIASLSASVAAAAAAGPTSGVATGVGHFTSEEVKAAVSYVRTEKAAADAAAAAAALAAVTGSSGNTGNGPEAKSEADAAVASLQQEQQPAPLPPPPPPQRRQPTAFELLKMQRHQQQNQLSSQQPQQQQHSPLPLPTQKVHLRGGGQPLGLLTSQQNHLPTGSGGVANAAGVGHLIQRHSQIRPAYPGIVLRHPSGAALSPYPHGRLPLTTSSFSRLAPLAAGNSLIRPPMPPPPPPPQLAQTTSTALSASATAASTTIRLPTPNRVFSVHVSAPGQSEQPRQGPKRKSMIVLPEGDTLFIEGSHPNLESVISSVLESHPGYRQARAEAAAAAAAAAAAVATTPTSADVAFSAVATTQPLVPPPMSQQQQQQQQQQPVVARMVQQFPKTKAIIKNTFKTIQLQQLQLQQQQQQQLSTTGASLSTVGPAVTSLTFVPSQSLTYTISPAKLGNPIVRTADKIPSIFDSPPAVVTSAVPSSSSESGIAATATIAVTSAAAPPFKVSFKEYMNVKLKMEQKRQDELELTRGRLIDHLGRGGAVDVAAPIAAAPAASGSSTSASGKRILFPYSVSVPKWATRGQGQQETAQPAQPQPPTLPLQSPTSSQTSSSILSFAAAPSTPVSAAPLGILHGKLSVLRAVPAQQPTQPASAAVAPPVLVLAAAQRTTDLQRQAAQFPVSLLKKSTILQMPHGVLPASPAPVSVSVSSAAVPVVSSAAGGPIVLTAVSNSSSPSKQTPQQQQQQAD